MDSPRKIDLFLSYSHKDEDYLRCFIDHMSPFTKNDSINIWYDGQLDGGDELKEIDKKIENVDIICLFISSHFLASAACNSEMDKAFDLKQNKGVVVFPIILSFCEWKEVKRISDIKAYPKDGNPITSFCDNNAGWLDVCEGIKQVINKLSSHKEIKISDSFRAFLNDADLLSKAHSKKTDITIDDIFIYPELRKQSFIGDPDKKISATQLVDEICINRKILLIGGNQSGKTTLCKRLFLDFREKDMIPVYLSDIKGNYNGKIKHRIKQAFNEQYNGIKYDDLEINKIVPIVDDFHLANNKDVIIADLIVFDLQILVVDEIFKFNIKDEESAKKYSQYKIKSFSPLLRNKLIRKWILLDESIGKGHDNDLYKFLDDATDMVDSSLGKVLCSGIMPSYPFFILSILSTYETYNKPLDCDITSQGYCYQSLIYLYLRKQGVKNSDIDTYLNFLSEISYRFYKNSKSEMSVSDFDDFMSMYEKKFNLSVNVDAMLSDLSSSKILEKNCMGNLYFPYYYLYYFFVARYFSEHLEESENEISKIIANLHKDENAYISIFIAHHTKNNYLLDEIVVNALCLFDEFPEASLSSDEQDFFELESIIELAIPNETNDPDTEREERLKQKDLLEENMRISREQKDNELYLNALLIEIRRSVKTVEVMGRIVKNRAGSLNRDRLEQIISVGMNVQLRLLSSFFYLIKNSNAQNEIIAFIHEQLKMYVAKQKRIPDDNKLKSKAREIFWNLNYGFVCGNINMIINSLGSDKLHNIISKICNDKKTPATSLIKHGILMWHCKNLQLDDITQDFSADNFSETAKSVMRYLVVNHSAMHNIDYKAKQKIEEKLNIPVRKMIQANYMNRGS